MCVLATYKYRSRVGIFAIVLLYNFKCFDSTKNINRERERKMNSSLFSVYLEFYFSDKFKFDIK